MLQLRDLDSVPPIMEQISTDASPVVLINLFQVDEADVPALIKAWEIDATWMKKQPGYISTQLHRAVGRDTAFLNYAVWDSVEDFRNAFAHPDFQATLAGYPNSVVASPHLFTKVAVPNLCTE